MPHVRPRELYKRNGSGSTLSAVKGGSDPVSHVFPFAPWRYYIRL